MAAARKAKEAENPIIMIVCNDSGFDLTIFDALVNESERGVLAGVLGDTDEASTASDFLERPLRVSIMLFLFVPELFTLLKVVR